MLEKMRELDSEDEIRKCFRVFDKDGNGQINFLELKYMMDLTGSQKCTAVDIEDILKEADTNGNGQLDYEGTNMQGCQTRQNSGGVSEVAKIDDTTWIQF